MAGHENNHRPDRVLWRWLTGAAFTSDGVKRNDSTWFRAATRDYDPDEFIQPPETLREEIRRDISEFRCELRERRAMRKRGDTA